MAIRAYRSVFPTLGKDTYIDDTAVIVGDIHCGDDVSIWPLVAARGDVNKIRIGARTNVQDGTVLHVTRKSATNPDGHPLIIGEDVTIGHKCMLHGCQLGNRILVGMGAIIMDGAIVEDDVFIGAGALVPPNKKLESGYLYVGSPVKQARPLNDGEKAFLAISAKNYVELKDEYIAAESPAFATPDLCDDYSHQLKIAEPVFHSYGQRQVFSGEIVTVKCYQDNSKVKELVATDGTGKVMVVDGGASPHQALLGDMLAEKAAQNGWQGIVINGCIRDVDIINQTQLGVKALGTVPLKTEKKGAGETNVNLRFAGVEFIPGHYLYADNNGLVLSPQPLPL